MRTPSQWSLPAAPSATAPDAPSREARLRAVVGALLDRIAAEGTDDVPLDAQHLVAAPFGYVFRFSRVAGLPARLQFSFRLDPGTPLVVWVDEGGARRLRYVPGATAWAVQPLVEALVALAAGDEFEAAYALAARHPLFPTSTLLFPDGWWTTWKDRQLADDQPGTVGEAYRAHVYPWVERIVARVAAGRGAMRVLDVCGGDGEALAGVLGVLPAGSSATLIDRNEGALAAARRRVPDAAAVAADVGADPEVIRAAGPADLVLLIGALAVNVLSPDVAVDVARAVASALTPGGVAIAAGWTPCLLEADDWAALGLVPFNTSRPAPARTWVGQQLYGLYKPESA